MEDFKFRCESDAVLAPLWRNAVRAALAFRPHWYLRGVLAHRGEQLDAEQLKVFTETEAAFNQAFAAVKEAHDARHPQHAVPAGRLEAYEICQPYDS